VGLVATVLAAHSDLIGSWVIAGTNVALRDTDGPTQVLVGLTIASLGSQLREWIKARDNTDTAVKPALIPPRQAARRMDKAA
jgi:hypothetical protein